MTALEFFRRSCGNWSSQRRFTYFPKTKPVVLTSQFRHSEVAPSVFETIEEGKTTSTMELSLQGDLMHRSCNHFNEDPSVSKIEVIDESCIVLYHLYLTQYDGTRFREEIRLIEDDMFRLRQTVGYSIRTGQLAMVGQYFESRIY